MADETKAEHDARIAREVEVAGLIVRAFDPDDEYDGHHGNDRSEK